MGLTADELLSQIATVDLADVVEIRGASIQTERWASVA